MKSTEFKNKVKEIKGFLKGKEIVLSLINKNGIETFKFNSLKAFGNKILELEKIGAGFSFTTVANSFVEKGIITERELAKWSNQGVWTKIHINASTL